jgi:hypothetical protein
MNINTIKRQTLFGFNRARLNPKWTAISAVLDWFLFVVLVYFHHSAWALIPATGVILAVAALLNPVDDYDFCDDCGEYDDDCQCLLDDDDPEYDEPV